MASHICGCYALLKHRRHYLPQVELSSHTLVTPLFFTTKLTQTFSNDLREATPETRYTFPLYDGVAVSEFTCTIGERVITGRVEEKQQARQTYQDAVARGETAGLLESLPSGIFGITLGNIPAKTNVIVNITYGGELKHDAEIDGLRYMLPTSIAPRYGQYPGEISGGLTSFSSHGIRITVDFNMGQSSIRKIQSVSRDHPIALSIGSCADEPSTTLSNPSKASVALTRSTTELSADFVLQVLVDNISTPKAVMETHPTLSGQKAVMATLVPKFKLDNISPEIVFVADQSGSMQGAKNHALVSALKIFLKSLPLGVRFNICAFGSRHAFLWEKSQPYTKSNLSKALDFILQFRAEYGGTEMFLPIKETFDKHLADVPLEVFLLTDGQSWREEQLLELVNKKIQDEKMEARVFTLGIGDNVSHTLLESVARAGCGFCQFVTETEPMDQKILRMLKAAVYPHINDCTFEISYGKDLEEYEMIDEEAQAAPATPEKKAVLEQPKIIEKSAISLFNDTISLDGPIESTVQLPNITAPNPLQAPNRFPTLLPWTRATAYLLLESNAKVPEQLILRAKTSQGPLELTIPIQDLGQTTVATVHTLAARAAVGELEEGRGWVYDAKVQDEPMQTKYSSCFDQIVEREAVRLSAKFQVASKWASFVAIKDDATKAQDNTEISIEQPLLRQTIQRTCQLPYYAAAANASHRASSGQDRSGGSSRSQVFSKGAVYTALPAFSSPTPSNASPRSIFGAPSLAQHAAGTQSISGSSLSSPTFSGSAQESVPTASVCSQQPEEQQMFYQSAPRQIQHLLEIDPAAMQGVVFDSQVSKAKKKKSVAPQVARSDDYYEHMLQQTLDPDLTKVRQLVDAQDFDGYWEADNALFTLLGVQPSDIEAALGKRPGKTEATLVVLHLLDTKFQAWKDVWEMVAAKAKDWLQSQITETQRDALKNAIEKAL
ncbi:hypothetical protein MBLNU459_g5581t1 [Dothideomycetes sp. NU459]